MAITAAQIQAVVSVQGVDTAKTDLQSVGQSATNTGSIFKSALGGALSLAVGVAGQAFSFLKSQVSESIKDAMAHQEVMTQTAQAIKSTGDASGMSAASIGNLATSLSQVTDFSNDTIQSGENLLLTFTGIGKQVFPDATKSMLDMAQAMHQGPEQAAMLLGKALNDPATGLSALTRVGVTFSSQEQTQIKTMMAHNDVIGAQKVMLGELSKEFGGSAQAAGQTFGGQLQILQNKLEDVRQRIGSALLPILGSLVSELSSTALPILQRFSDWFVNTAGPAIQSFTTHALTFLKSVDLGPISSTFKNLGDTVRTVGPSFLQFFANFSPGITLFQTLSSHAQDLGKWFQTAVVPALQQAQPGFNNLGQALVALLPVVNTISSVIHNVMVTAFTAMIPIVEKVIPLVIQVSGIIANGLGTAIKFASPYIQQATQALGQFADQIIQRVAPIVSTWVSNLQTDLNDFLKVWSTVWPVLSPILAGVWQEIRGIVQVAWSLVSGIILIGLDILGGNWKQAWSDLKNMLSGVWDGIKTYLSGAWSVIKSIFNDAWSAIKSIFGPVGQWFHDRFSEASNGVQSAFANVKNFFTGIWSGITNGLQAAWSFIVGAFNTGVQAVVSTFNYLYEHSTLFQTIVDTIKKVISDGVQWLTSTWTKTSHDVTTGWQTLVSDAQRLWNSISNAVKNGWNAAIGFVTAIWKDISNVFSSAWNTYIASPLTSLWNNISSTFNNAWNTYVATPVGNFWKKFSNAISGAWSTVQGSLSSLWTNISNWFSGVVGDAVSWGENLINSLASGIENATAGALQSAVNAAANTVKNAVGWHSPTKEGPGSDSDKWAPNFVNMFVSGLQAGIPKIKDAVSQLASPIAVSLNPRNIGFAAPSFQPQIQNTVAPQIVVQPAPIYLDGRLLSNGLMPYIANNIQYGTGKH